MGLTRTYWLILFFLPLVVNYVSKPSVARVVVNNDVILASLEVLLLLVFNSKDKMDASPFIEIELGLEHSSSLTCSS